MGDLFRNTQSSQSTSNQQVGVQGGVGVGAGTSGAVAAGGTAIQGGVGYGSSGATINITTSDIEALHLADSVTHDALASNTIVATGAINVAGQTAIEALHNAHDLSESLAQITLDASNSAQGIAARAAPQSPAATAEILGAQSNAQSKTVIIAIVGIAAFLALRMYMKKA
jgi:hypothetical protein